MVTFWVTAAHVLRNKKTRVVSEKPLMLEKSDKPWQVFACIEDVKKGCAQNTGVSCSLAWKSILSKRYYENVHNYSYEVNVE